MKPVCKTFYDLTRDEKSSCACNLFLICSSISLLTISILSVLKFFREHCYRRYEYKYDNECSYGCNENKCDCE